MKKPAKTAILEIVRDEELSAVSGARATFAGLHVTKRTDSASPSLMQSCATGVHYDAVKLMAR